MPAAIQDANDAHFQEKKSTADVEVAGIDGTNKQPQEALLGDQSDPQLRRLEVLRQQYGSTWESPDDPDDPYNWPTVRKVLTGLIFSLAQLVTLMTASIISAALNDIASDLHVDMSQAQIIFSTYFLGLGFGPFVVAALSEMYGRKWVWVGGNIWYILWNAISPVGKSANMMIVSRLMAGLGACAGVTLTGPTMADMYGKRERGKAASITALLPSLGPALGPIVGGIVTQWIEWPWIFRIMSIVASVFTLIGVFYIRESYTPALLRRKVRGRPLTPQEALTWHFWSEFSKRLGLGIWRPIRLLLTRPIVQLIAFVLALNFATYTLLLGTYATMFIDRYGQSESVSALHYISIALSATLAAQVGGRLMDAWYKRLSDRRGKGQGRPEFRVPYLTPGVVLFPIGLVMYGWAAEYTVAWPVVDIGTAIFELGSVIVTQTLTAYQLDEFVEHGASASAATKVLSYALGFAFPTFAPRLYSQLGYGWGNSMMALIWVVLCFPLPVVLWIWGEKIRAWGRRDEEHRIDGV
ncbi:major facilitator superfamily transporter [Trichoderma arundinaceum]|uniref:Major facilitator superfamily transporter n=1 Tax=Trichoderma arundinaceum TaxID=490622 RepID=A0A395NUZ9_TRIAR|nr:major facilitator superfamily transporter [Trichoderma arundinaceum]